MSISDVFVLFPTLYTDRLKLRQITSADTDHIFGLYSQAAVTQHLDIDTMTEPSAATALIQFFAERYQQGDGIRWAVTLRDDQLIGTCGFNYFDEESQWAEIGYDLSPAYWHQGIMSEALGAILRYGFMTVKLHRIEANVTAGNKASTRVLERLGFQQEGILRERYFSNNHYHDYIYYGLLQSEYLNLSTNSLEAK